MSDPSPWKNAPHCPATPAAKPRPRPLCRSWGKARDAVVSCLRSGSALPPSAHDCDPSHPCMGLWKSSAHFHSTLHFLSLGHFSCSTAPQAFPRPDRGMLTPSRAVAVKVGRLSVGPTRLHGFQATPLQPEHGGRLVRSGPEAGFGSVTSQRLLISAHIAA